ncbi:hypothetical protein N9F00_03330 [Planktomarina temperata]|nr:hypothetical protein [Planktomarina temperata]
MKNLIVIFCGIIFFSTQSYSETVSISVPSAVREAVDVYRAECTDEGGELELDGDEISKLWTDEGEEAYVIHAAFTCGDLGHLWCGAMGHCPTDLVINNKFYSTNRILQKHPNRISIASDGTVTYWMPDGLKLMVER